jgi:hypothetical protein
MDGRAAAELRSETAALVSPALLRAVSVFATLAYVALVGWGYRAYAMDDAYIGFAYIANLLAGNGLVFTPGAPVEGVTNIGWLLLIAPLAAFAGPIAAAKIAALVLVLASLALVLIAARRLALPLAAEWSGFAKLPVTVLVLVVGASDFIAFSMLGMETALLAALLLAAFAASLNGPRPVAWAVLGTLAFLTHPEAVLVVPLALAIALATRAIGRDDALRCVVLFAGLIAAATAVRLIYYGDVLPNTFLAKPSSGLKVVAHVIAFATGRFANVAEPFTSVFALALCGPGYMVLRRVSPLASAFAAAAAITGLLFGLYANPDWTLRGRYFAPYAPLALLLLALGTFDIARRLSALPRSASIAAAALIAGVALPGIIQTFILLTPAARLSYPGYVMAGSTLVGPAEWIRDALPADATIATRRVGVLGYTAPQTIFDYKFGLSDRAVAATIRAHNRQFDDPRDAALETLWRERAPDYLLEDGNTIDKIAGGNRASFRIHGFEYRVVKTFAIGKDAEWTLAERVSPRPGSP